MNEAPKRERRRNAYQRKMRIYTHLRQALPWRARIKLRRDHYVNVTGAWLVEHEHFRAARILWRI